MLKNNPQMTLASLAFNREWRTAALPVAFILLSVELQQHWQGDGRWIYLAAVALISICWISALFGQAWAVRNAGTTIDAVVLLLMAGGVWLAVQGDARVDNAPAGTLTFWAPLLCVWWALSFGNGFGRLITNMLVLHTGLFFLQANTENLFLPRLLLSTLLVLLVRFAGQRYSRFPGAGSLDLSYDDPLVDNLTGVASPAYFEAELAHTAAISDRYQQPFSLIACRIEAIDSPAESTDFTSENGKKLLKTLAQALVDWVRIADTVCRWENGKFFVLLPNTKFENAQLIAGKIRGGSNAIAAGSDQRVTIRIGVCEHRAGEDPMQTFMVADDALSEPTPPDPGPNRS